LKYQTTGCWTCERRKTFFDYFGLNLFKRFDGVLNSVIGLIAEKRPLLYIGLPGFVMFVIGVFFGILLLQQYNQTRYFSLAYAMLISIFMILGAIGLLILFYGSDVECDRAVEGRRTVNA